MAPDSARPLKVVIANACAIVARPARTETSVRDGDLLGTLTGGAAGAALVGWGAAGASDAWMGLGVGVLCLPVALGLAWLAFGPSRRVLRGDDLVSVGRVKTCRVHLPRLAAVTVDHGLRTVSLVLREHGGACVSLHDLSDDTGPLRHVIGTRIAAVGMGDLVRDARTRRLLGLG